MTPKKYSPKHLAIYARNEMKHRGMARKFYDDKRVSFSIEDLRDKGQLEMALDGIVHQIYVIATKIAPTLEYNSFKSVNLS